MGIFDVFKTKVSEAAGKAGDLLDRDKSKDQPAQAAEPGTTAVTDEDDAAQMVSEGAPVAEAGEAAPGVGDDGAAAPDGSGGMTGTIKQNLSSGVDKAADMADSASGGKHTDQIKTGAEKAKDMLR